MTSNRGGDKGSRELNHDAKDEDGRGGNGIVADGQGSFREDELRINKVDENVKDGRGQVVQGQVILKVQLQQSQGSVVHWERFLHVRTIKVMLVEKDDSTRHIVTALLRNCNYEVIEAANGLQAWRILEDLTNHVDIVLTEVLMPCLSGIGLLCKIMSHKTRNNIPVIMMSSHDSMGLVFKCLSKGAVDFLVKPIRKNELKNLWQHVWRRCHSSSGSGSESGAQTQKSVKSKSSVRSGNSRGSNIWDAKGSSGDGSDDVSGTQSSWTKQAVEVDSPRAASPWDQIDQCPDSTCGVIRSAETPGARDFHEQEQQLDYVAKSKELVIGKPRNCGMQTDSLVEVPIKLKGTENNTVEEPDPAQNIKRKDKRLANPSGEYSSNKHKTVGSNMPDPQMDNGEFEALREPAKILEKTTKAIHDSNEVAVIELSLKRRGGVKDTGRAVQNYRNVLRHSELSAFSRYNTSSNAFKAPHGITGSSSQLVNSLEIVKKESVCEIRSHSDGCLIYQSSNETGNNIDGGSTTNKLSTDPVILKDKSEATFVVNCLHPSSSFKPIKTDIRCPSQQDLLRKVDDMASTDVLDPPRILHHELPVQHIHHHHHVHHFHNMNRQQPLSNHDDLSLKKLAADAPHSGSSNVLDGPTECSPKDYSLNRSASGSKNGSNGQKGSSNAMNVGGTNVESDVGLAGKSGSGDASGSGSGNRINQHKSAQREAALTKFRQKRKERCFQKKVRYQKRKRLAEQRPRVRGQFARQTGQHSSNNAAGS